MVSLHRLAVDLDSNALSKYTNLVLMDSFRHKPLVLETIFDELIVAFPTGFRLTSAPCGRCFVSEP